MAPSKLSGSVTEIERPKRGPKWEPPWQGDLGLFRHASPREAVSDAILGLIRGGELRPGMRLPSEPQLVRMTGISRSSVREAVRSLQTMGLLEVRRGQGTFVRNIDSESVTDAQLLLLLDDHTVLENLVEVRCALEPLIARVAAERATDEDIAAIGDALHAMTSAHGMDEWRPAHLAFHKAVVDATHNIILMKIWGLITVFLKDSPLVTGSLRVTMPHVHIDLYEAIRTRDGSKTAAAMAEHITDMQRALNE
ncbi:MAG: FadR/GntR family transcriptional regulator [Thermomicrobiales bacterium]